MEMVVFFVLAVLAVACGVGVIAQRNAARSALFLLACFCCVAGLYILLNAEFLAMAQLIVYAGAIVVLFLFVVLLLGAEGAQEQPGTRQTLRSARGQAYWVAGALLAALLLAGILWAVVPAAGAPAQALPRADNVRQIGEALLSGFAIPFELTAVVLLAAIVGVVVLAKKRLEG
jgi:NADH-quinone oxidoreductase subunit J